ncbi:MAG: hypothetical protein KDK25_03615 [Leptospiraceae bacterium]|nr:hypothetical protein [Leptospiraceae bacterium]
MLLILGTYVSVHFTLALDATAQEHAYLDQFEKPRAFSRYSTVLHGLYPGLIASNAFDRNPGTCFREPLAPSRKEAIAAISATTPTTVPDYAQPTISGEVGLSHAAGDPPLPLQFTEMTVEFCQSQISIRPASVQVQFFRQKLYDVDRQYRIPDPPEFWTSRDFSIQKDQQTWKLNLEAFRPSSGFPEEFYNVWVRLIFAMPPGADENNHELCIRDIKVGQKAFFPVREGNDGTCP